MWYVTNQHQVINDAAQRKSKVQPIPSSFDKYVGYNDCKRKKQKEQPMSISQLESHGQSLYSLLSKPIINTSQAWKTIAQEIEHLAQCFLAYKDHLKQQNETQTTNQALDHPVRQISSHATLQYRSRQYFPVSADSKYSILDKVMSLAAIHAPIFFDEEKHLDKPFESPLQKFRFFRNMILSVPVDIVKYCPGGSAATTVVLTKVDEKRNESTILTEGARFLQKIQPQLGEYHTRQQMKNFSDKMSNIAHLSPAVKEYMYKYLTGDASMSQNQELQERVHLISLGHPDIVEDLRSLSSGRPKMFEPFFDKLAEVVEEKTVADDRRQNVAHLSEWLSLEDLRSQTAAKCSTDTQIPSISLLRLQFVPRNPYVHASLRFTSRIAVQHKIQRRQLRVQHPDDHYCLAQFKYLKEKAVEQRQDVALFFCDDKAKIPIREPNAPVSTGVRGKKSVAPVSTTISALDHDMTKASLTPSVILHCSIPESTDKSFVQGTVTTCINDSVFQASNPFRHAMMLIRVAQGAEQRKTMLLKFTDGGTDQRNNLEAVKCAGICIFKELNLDMLIHARCAPGHSYTNPAERVMSVLNIGIQNCALERQELDKDSETNLKRFGSMADIRTAAVINPALKQKWHETISPVQSIVESRFKRLKLKEEPMQSIAPLDEDDIDHLKRHLRTLFPKLDVNKLQKAHTAKVTAYNDWLERHCRVRHYTFQIRKCDDSKCCTLPVLDRTQLAWLPDPVLDPTGEHYLKYQSQKTSETTDKDRPSLQKPKPTRKRKNDAQPSQVVSSIEQVAGASAVVLTDQQMVEQQGAGVESTVRSKQQSLDDYGLYTAQHARASIQCVECRKPRVIYSKQKLSERHNLSLTLALSEHEYSCGAPILPPNSSLLKSVQCRSGLACSLPVEVAYYSSNIGRLDICAHCGSEEAVVDLELKKKFKTVLPLCGVCDDTGLKAIVLRPYGKKR